MKISKKDALSWFEFFAQLPEDEPLPPRQQEIALAALSQIEVAEAARIVPLPFFCAGGKKSFANICRRC